MNFIKNEHTTYTKPFTLTSSKAVRKTLPTRNLQLGIIDLKEDKRPKNNKRYSVISAGDYKLESAEIPQSSHMLLDLDLYALYIDDLPDFNKKNEGLLKISINTKNPQDLKASDTMATLVTNFTSKDGSYAPSFLYKGVFRNILLEKWVNLKFDLYELDSGAEQYFSKVKQVINGVPEIKHIDVLKGMPYISLATSLFESIISTFGRSKDDHMWGEIPLLDINPTIGGAFLRSGIYVLFEDTNSQKAKISYRHLEYMNERLVVKKSITKKTLSNHLLFGVQLRGYKG